MTENAPTPEEVLAFLKANPSFLDDHPEVIDILMPPKGPQQQGKRVVDFQSFVIERLKADKIEIENATREIVQTARNNMNNQGRMHRAVLRLLEAENFDDFIQAITGDLTTILDIDITTLVVEAQGKMIPHVHTAGIRLVPDGTVDRWMEGKKVLLQSNIQGSETIYAGGAPLVRSQALVRVDIAKNTPPAILAFGSRDPNLFEDGQATDLVLFLARVVERLFRAWLAIA